MLKISVIFKFFSGEGNTGILINDILPHTGVAFTLLFGYGERKKVGSH